MGRRISDHIWKTERRFFADVWQGLKTFEVRQTVQDFSLNPGQTVTLIEIESAGMSTGRQIHAVVGYVLNLEKLNPNFKNWHVFSLEHITIEDGRN